MREYLHPSLIRDSEIAAAFRLLLRTLPHATARFCVLVASFALCLLWLAIALGGGWWIGNHVSAEVGIVWSLIWLMGGGFIWGTVLRYFLHLIACAHVAVLTHLMTHGSVGDRQESQFGFGRRFVLTHFGELTALFAMNQLIRGVLVAVHDTLHTLNETFPIAGLTTAAATVERVRGAATRYLDKVVLTYCLACDTGSVWQNSREGLVYYAQNTRATLKTPVWIVIAERCSSALLLLAAFTIAAAITVVLPPDYREVGRVIAVAVAVMFAIALGAVFLEPLFLILLILRFHLLVEDQPLNAQWSARLDRLFADWHEPSSGRPPLSTSRQRSDR
jgi:hypothetical protein